MSPEELEERKYQLELKNYDLEVKKYELTRRTARLTIWSVVLSQIITALLGISLGTILERQKQKSTEEMIFLEHRMKVWVATATHFPNYIVNWQRLRTITAKANLTPIEQERKNKYATDRSRARDDLLSALEQAKYVFSTQIRNMIDQFEEFDERNASVPLKDLAPVAQWRMHEQIILNAMKNELRHA